MMNSILKDLLDRGVVSDYMDDIIVFTKTLKEHREVMREVLTRLRDNDLFLNPQKCVFEKDEIEYLGVVISKDRIKMDSKKVEGVKDWPEPRRLKELQGFLGFANYY
jgi:hypothetical protein